MTPRVQSIIGLRLFFLPVQTRVPLKFGTETLTSVTCARVALKVADDQGNQAEGWGETPLSVQWVWPGPLPYAYRENILKEFCKELAASWILWREPGHPLEIGYDFQEQVLPELMKQFNARSRGIDSKESHNVKTSVGLPRLAALVCNSAFDIALHDAYGKLVERPVYETYNKSWLHSDLARFLKPASDVEVCFSQVWPDAFFTAPKLKLPAWHLVGGLDALGPEELSGTEPQDGYPVTLPDWIRRDGLTCLKIKLRGNDAAWDYERLVKVGQIGGNSGVEYLSADFNCTVQEPAYVNEILDQLQRDHHRIWSMILYVEQPFPYELENHRICVRSVSERKPLFLDESAHDWRMVRLGRELGWTGVALKTCKTQTGAILAACWAKAHGLSLMVQDLTNPMLAQIPHALLAAHVGTIMGLETNAMQFYPAASEPEMRVHPGLYRRQGGTIELSTVAGSGFGYRLGEIHRELPMPALEL